MSAMAVSAISKSYGHTRVLSDVSLAVAENSITAILGPSGSGKTTLLRMIAGFERAESGSITVAGQVVDDDHTHVRPERRGIGYVPQEGALFPHLTVARNIGFGLARRDRPRVTDLLDLVGLSGFAHRYPHQLSGGQQQRVALARALAIQPRLVLLDEPFSSLDASLRISMRRDVARVLADAKTAAVIVTHDQDEALSLADHIVILDEGRVLAEGSPSALYNNPASPAAASYLGDANLLAATIADGLAHCALGALGIRNASTPIDGPATVLVRPEQMRLRAAADGDGMLATIAGVDYHGHDSVAVLTLADSSTLIARVAGEQHLRTGVQVRVHVADGVFAWADQ